MSEQDQKAFKMYGKVPAKNVLMKTQKVRFSSFSTPCKPPFVEMLKVELCRTVNTLTLAII